MANIKETILTQEYLHSILEYKDGLLYWKVSRSAKIHIGDRAGWFNKQRSGIRYSIRIDQYCYFGARIIFFMHYNWWPKMVDHRDRDTTNNRIKNLRAADGSQNGVNVTKKDNTTSKYLGVHYSQCKTTRKIKTTGEIKTWSNPKWVAQITVNKKRVCLGRFETEIEAAIAFNKGALFHYGEFANLNNV